MAGSDMAGNGNGNGTFDPIASYARLSERVEGQGRDIVDLRSNVNTGFRNVEGSIKALSDQLAAGGRTQWPVIWAAIGVSFTVLSGLGFMAYQPVLKEQTRLEDALVRMADTSVSQKELEWRTARGVEDRTRTEKSISEIRADLVGRGEHEQKWSAYDQRSADLQRQLDEVKASLGSVYNARDVILDLRERLDRIETSRVRPYSPTPP